MTSIGSYTKQIPLNNGYFRALTGIVGNPSSFVYAPSGTLSDGRISSMVAANASTLNYNLSSALFKDMGAQAVVNGSTFRRLQIVAANGATDGVDGQNVGNDQDYFAFWILTGFNGDGVPSPFIRA